MNPQRALSQADGWLAGWMAKMGVRQLNSLCLGKEVGPDLRWAFRKHCSDHCYIESGY